MLEEISGSRSFFAFSTINRNIVLTRRMEYQIQRPPNPPIFLQEMVHLLLVPYISGVRYEAITFSRSPPGT